MREHLASARTFLFVPGDRPGRFEKASAAGADIVVIDLEDAVAKGHKDVARENALAWIRDGNPCAVRINALDTAAGRADLAALGDRDCVVMVAKADDPSALTRRLDGHPVIALIETARGILVAAQIAAAAPVCRLAFGSFDLAAELGVSPDDREATASARSALVMASAAAGLPGPIDGVTGDVIDTDRLTDDVGYSSRLGFTGKLCIHPAQVPVAASALAPNAHDLAWAQQVVAASVDGVAIVDGCMVDKPVVDRARRILMQRAVS